MSLKTSLQRLLARAARQRRIREWILGLRGRILGGRGVYQRRPPFDRELGIDASGTEPAYLLGLAAPGDYSKAIGYLGVVPSVLRAALMDIPDPASRGFVDLGCGKGRALAMATEWPFQRILGIELSPELARIARRNAECVRKSHPERTPIEVIEGDATAPSLPEGALAIYFYHPFGEALIAKLVDALARAAETRDLVISYVNPVYAHVFDARPVFRRWAARSLPIADEDRPFCEGDHELLLMWRAGPIADFAPRPGADRQLVVTEPGLRVEFAP